MCGLTVGGVTSNGSDAVNDLSYLFPDGEEDTTLTSKTLRSLRISMNTYKIHIAKIIAKGDNEL